MLKSHDVDGAAAHARQPADAPGAAAHSCSRRSRRSTVRSAKRGCAASLQVFEEHLYTEQLQVALRTAINAFPRQVGMPARAAHDVSERAARPRPADGRGAARARRRRNASRSGRRRRWRTSGALRSRTRCTSSRCRSRPRSRCGRPPTGSHRCAGSCRRQCTVWAGGEMTRRVRKTLPGVVLIPDLAASVDMRFAAGARTGFRPRRLTATSGATRAAYTRD